MKKSTLLLFVILICAPVLAHGISEKDKIEMLIKSVESLNGAVFIRNGSEHNPEQAGEHLRLKLRKAGKKVKSAEDFIKYIGSRSSMSGEKYLIKFSDGRIVETETYFRERLKEIEGKTK